MRDLSDLLKEELRGKAFEWGINPDSVGITRELEQEARAFKAEAERTVETWYDRNRDKVTTEGYEELWAKDGAYLIYTTLAGYDTTLSGPGVGIWDGDWDPLFVCRRDIRDLEQFLRASLSKYIDVAGGGTLPNAIRNAIRNAVNEDLSTSDFVKVHPLRG